MMIEVRKLHKYYDTDTSRLHVLKGINFTAEKSDFMVIAGPSGAGKSTLLHLVGGLDVPAEGEVLLNGINIYKIREGERARLRSKIIGFVFQFYHLLSECTALENIMLPARILGMDIGCARKRALHLLHQVGLEKRAAHHPSQLSGGEQQRVAIARALINEPQILICDEPTGNLDSHNGAKICELLTMLNREHGYTIMVATHSEEVARLSSRRVVIRDGQIVEDKKTS